MVTLATDRMVAQKRWKILQEFEGRGKRSHFRSPHLKDDQVGQSGKFPNGVATFL